MAKKYNIQFNDIDGALVDIDIYKDGYSGSIASLDETGSGDSIRFISPTVDDDDPIHSVSCEIDLLSTSSYQWLEFLRADEYEYVCEITVAGVMKFNGNLLRGTMIEPLEFKNFATTITFNDGLAQLRNEPYLDGAVFYTGMKKIVTIITDCLKKIYPTNQLLPIGRDNIFIAPHIEDSTGTAWQELYLNTKQFRDLSDFQNQKAISCYEVLERILRSCKCQLRIDTSLTPTTHIDYYITFTNSWTTHMNTTTFGYTKYTTASGALISTDNKKDWSKTLGTDLEVIGGVENQTLSFFPAVTKVKVVHSLDHQRNWIHGNFADPDEWITSSALANWNNSGTPVTTQVSIGQKTYLFLTPTATGADSIFRAKNIKQYLGDYWTLNIKYLIREDPAHAFTFTSDGDINTANPNHDVFFKIEMTVSREGTTFYYSNDGAETAYLTSTVNQFLVLDANAANNWEGLVFEKEQTFTRELIIDTYPTDAIQLSSKTGDMTQQFRIYEGKRIRIYISEISLKPKVANSERISKNFTTDIQTAPAFTVNQVNLPRWLTSSNYYKGLSFGAPVSRQKNIRPTNVYELETLIGDAVSAFSGGSDHVVVNLVNYSTLYSDSSFTLTFGFKFTPDPTFLAAAFQQIIRDMLEVSVGSVRAGLMVRTRGTIDFHSYIVLDGTAHDVDDLNFIPRGFTHFLRSKETEYDLLQPLGNIIDFIESGIDNVLTEESDTVLTEESDNVLTEESI